MAVLFQMSPVRKQQLKLRTKTRSCGVNMGPLGTKLLLSFLLAVSFFHLFAQKDSLESHVDPKGYANDPGQAVTGQDEINNTSSKKSQLNGYLKNMVTLNITNDSVTLDNLIHNRLNYRWFYNENLTVYLEVRNRLFAGDLVRTVPGYDDAVDLNNDYLDLSVQGPEGRSWLLQSMIDRAFLEWYTGDWEVRIGRQRINWGMNLVWNPNDLFNAYSFFDFDYEERPGSDAIRIKRYTGFASSIEVAGNIHDDFDEVVFAGMWKINKWGYDLQFLAGKAREDITIGLGWAGNLKDAGFKGEVTWFYPYTNSDRLSPTLLSSISIDYSFENSLYLQGSVLFNSVGSDAEFLDGLSFSNTGRLTARDLSPFEYSTLLQVNYAFHPLVSGSLSTIYYPGRRNALFLNPGFTFSVKPNIDLDLIGQVYFDKLAGEYQALARLIYTRVKWSF